MPARNRQRVDARSLAALRKRFGTQERVAKVLGMGRTTVAKYEAEGGPLLYWWALRGLVAEMQK